MYSSKIFVVGVLFVIVANLTTLIVSQTSINVTTTVAPTSQNSTKVASLTVPGTNKSISLSVTKKQGDEEDCEDDEPVPEAEGKAKSADNRQGKELNLTDKEKYSHGNATAEPEPEGEPGSNSTSKTGAKDKLTGANSTAVSPGRSGAGLPGSSCLMVGVATLSAVFMRST